MVAECYEYTQLSDVEMEELLQRKEEEKAIERKNYLKRREKLYSFRFVGGML